jgi:hypothetical protein
MLVGPAWTHPTVQTGLSISVIAHLSDLDQLEAEQLDPFQQTVKLRLVGDRPPEHGLGGPDGGVHIFECGEQAVSDQAPYADFIARGHNRDRLPPQRVMSRHPPWVKPAGATRGDQTSPNPGEARHPPCCQRGRMSRAAMILPIVMMDPAGSAVSRS